MYGDPMGVIRVCLYEVWKVYGGHRGSIISGLGSVWGSLGAIVGHKGSFIRGLGSIGGQLY